MRSLVAAILSLFLPSRGAHPADTPLFLTSCPPVPARRPRPYPTDVIAVDGQPLVRPYVVVWERERDERERRRCRAAGLTPLGQEHFLWEAAV
ncbi:hypothetical protein ABT124_15775 [Streptomyces sp. NPDC001982]|uniref:hypothetical protein n=1 Tax=Streptomyces sp. NPDC001982 TaxID=3154405 RepID=UPI00331BD3E8